MIRRILLTGLFFGAVLPAQAESDQKEPEWIEKTDTVCSSKEICAVGVGPGLNSAKANARSELAKIFETQIEASFETILNQNDDDESFKIRDYVSENSNVLLNAVEIKETFVSPTTVYALAVLNKPLAARISEKEMNDLDQKMSALLQDDSPAAAVRLEKFYEQRRAMNQRHIILTGTPKTEKITYEQVYAHKKNRIGKRHIFLTTKEPNKALDQTVRGVLRENGYTFARKPDKQTPFVTVSVQSEKQYAKIDGFVKYQYRFTMTAPDKKGKIVDVLTTTLTETGRNEQQAFSNALEALKVYLNENVLNLNF